MTKDSRKSRGTKGSEVKVLPWRTFKDRPSGIWIEETVAQITETGQPELIESLYRNSIPKDAKFRKLRQLITVNGTRRPDGDLCPCPMCAPNRFLTGTLVWFPDLQCCAFIGNCCADADVLAEADRVWKFEEKRKFEEDYLLANLPLVAPKLAILEKLKPVALEATRAYRKFRTSLPQVHELLRRMKHQHGDQLTLTEIIRNESTEDESDYYGPAGSKGEARTRSRPGTIPSVHLPATPLS
ncbi:hypothetical protein [Bradyrhizobium sp. 27S5]|uniref:hypothetical protein n=1 Tax=Bradyrhizobium sp. 27S5 TaxID=3139728 RepID=UPI0030D4F67B